MFDSVPAAGPKRADKIGLPLEGSCINDNPSHWELASKKHLLQTAVMRQAGPQELGYEGLHAVKVDDAGHVPLLADHQLHFDFFLVNSEIDP